MPIIEWILGNLIDYEEGDMGEIIKKIWICVSYFHWKKSIYDMDIVECF